MKNLREKYYKARYESRSIQRKISRKFLFRMAERLGFHIVGDHFYEPIPNLNLIEKLHDDTPRAIPGMPLNLDKLGHAHVTRLKKYGPEFLDATNRWGYVEKNHYFRGADALALYAFVRENQIETLIEVGQGFSTRVAAAALEANGIENGVQSCLITIDPYQRIPDGLNGNGHVKVSNVPLPVQGMDLHETFSKLGPSGLLFVDSSHVYKFGSDVEFLMRNVYPFVPSGTFIHVHDVCSPCPWPKEFYTKCLWFWNEQDFLETFLAFNPEYEVLLPVYWLCRDSLEVKEEMIRWNSSNRYKTTGYSFYMRRK
jgi:hypothetical protein